MKGKGALGVLLGLLRLPIAIFQSLRILRRYKADVVVGVGGYASFPVVVAAFLLGIPTAIQEQNAFPGLTNRILGKIAKAVFVSFDEAKAHFAEKKTFNVGNPTRKALFENFLRPQVRHDKFRLLVFGGSQGARAINAATVEAFSFLKDLHDRLEVLHQTGKADVAETKKAYEALGISATVVDFIDDMSAAYANSDLVVCRSGATTVAELTVCKKASILIPYPYAADNHQELNARALVEKGAARLLLQSELSGETLAREIRSLIESPGEREEMERAAGRLGRPEAAKEIADVCVGLVYKGREQGAG